MFYSLFWSYPAWWWVKRIVVSGFRLIINLNCDPIDKFSLWLFETDVLWSGCVYGEIFCHFVFGAWSLWKDVRILVLVLFEVFGGIFENAKFRRIVLGKRKIIHNPLITEAVCLLIFENCFVFQILFPMILKIYWLIYFLLVKIVVYTLKL